MTIIQQIRDTFEDTYNQVPGAIAQRHGDVLGKLTNSDGEPKSPGAERVLDERIRQIDVKGYTRAKDEDRYDELLAAARCYILAAGRTAATGIIEQPVPGFWPWDNEVWKPETPERNLVKAGALIAAAADSLEWGEGS